MTASSESEPPGPSTGRRSSFFGTLPLIVLTGILFAGAYLVYLRASRLGPGNFPLWGLLITLGFVAAIGAVVSWFFATDVDGVSSKGIETPSGDARGAGHGPRNDLGRPVPDLGARPAAPGPSSGLGRAVAVADPSAARHPEPWDEDALPPVAARGPRPVLTTLDDPGDIGRALEEIADIQRELSTRRVTPVAASESPTRA